MIPKIIHYVWLGGGKKNELIEMCMASWANHLPDYKIIVWGDESIKEIRNLYVQEAYECKKWAFVSDYLRLHALYHHGGFYFDTDLEIVEGIDKFREYEFVTGMEIYNKKISPVTALMGAKPGNDIVGDLLREYDGLKFIEKEGELNLMPNTKRITDYLIKNYAISPDMDPNKEIYLSENSVIFPYYFFCTPKLGEKNYSIHHFNGSWIGGFVRKNIIKISNYRISVIKRLNNKSSTLPLAHNERLIRVVKLLLSLSLMVTKKNND